MAFNRNAALIVFVIALVLFAVSALLFCLLFWGFGLPQSNIGAAICLIAAYVFLIIFIPAAIVYSSKLSANAAFDATLGATFGGIILSILGVCFMAICDRTSTSKNVQNCYFAGLIIVALGIICISIAVGFGLAWKLNPNRPFGDVYPIEFEISAGETIGYHTSNYNQSAGLMTLHFTTGLSQYPPTSFTSLNVPTHTDVPAVFDIDEVTVTAGNVLDANNPLVWVTKLSFKNKSTLGNKYSILFSPTMSGVPPQEYPTFYKD